MSTFKYMVNTKKELNELSKIFAWDEIFDMCDFSDKMLTLALAKAQVDAIDSKDKAISSEGFKAFFEGNPLSLYCKTI
jgi:hypothetical protein